jgi:rhomboid-like protein
VIAWKRSPRAWFYLNRYFLLSAGIPNTFSIVGAVFSHQFFYHLATNLAALYACGVPRKSFTIPQIHLTRLVYEEAGSRNFVAMYMGFGVVGSLTALYWHVLRRNFVYVSLGASGAVNGILGAYCTIQPE